jgi:hypothetical protein
MKLFTKNMLLVVGLFLVGVTASFSAELRISSSSTGYVIKQKSVSFMHPQIK